MRKLTAVLIALSSLAAAACFNVEQSLILEKNMSGTAGFSMKVDMEPVVGFIANLKHSVMKKPGTPSAADIAEARKELEASMAKSKPMDVEQEKEELRSQLPAGVQLLDVSFKDHALALTANLRFGFDQVSKLGEIKLNSKPASAGVPADNPMDSPFAGLQVVDDGKTVTITSKPVNPMADQKDQLKEMPEVDAALKTQLDAILRSLRVVYKITAPFEVIEHNAHRKEGNTLVWDFNLDSIEKLAADPMAQVIRAKFRK